MKRALGPLNLDEVKSVAKRLGVKPEEVVEMETRMSGQDISLEPAADDEKESYSPIAYLADAAPEPARLLENEQTLRLRHEGLGKAMNTLTSAAAASSKPAGSRRRRRNSARPRRRIQGVRGAYPPDRAESHAADGGRHRRSGVTPTLTKGARVERLFVSGTTPAAGARTDNLMRPVCGSR